MSKALNFLWLSLDAPVCGGHQDQPFRQPLPAHYLPNIVKTADANPKTDVILWVDTWRHSEAQMQYMREELATASGQNICLKDLRSIEAYRAEPLFNTNADVPNWCDEDKRSVMWRQVDLAKVLISLQGRYDQTFYADLDYAAITPDSPTLQHQLAKQGLIVRGSFRDDRPRFENQVWGFDQRHRVFFEELYAQTRRAASKGENGYAVFMDALKEKSLPPYGLKLHDICFDIPHDQSAAYHPDHVHSHGRVSESFAEIGDNEWRQPLFAQSQISWPESYKKIVLKL